MKFLRFLSQPGKPWFLAIDWIAYAVVFLVIVVAYVISRLGLPFFVQV